MSVPFERLVKVMELTASDHDGEALAAVRKANQIRQDMGCMWGDLLRDPTAARRCDQFPSGGSRPGADQEDDYEDMFSTIFSTLTLAPKWLGVLRRIESQWHAKGRLSPKQKNLVTKFYRSAVGAE